MPKNNSTIQKGWREMMFGDAITLHRGYDLPIERMEPGKYPVVFSNGKIEHHSEYMIKGPGVVTGRSGTLGNTFYMLDNFWPHNTTLYVSDFHGNNPRFVYYLLKGLDFSKLNAGSGVPTLNRNHVHATDIKIPDVKIQQQIASILTSLDDKIENNNGIIDTIETIAQTIFKEWFVKFRFPGYEKTKFVDSEMGKIPAGWEVKSVMHIVKRIPSGEKYDNTTALSNGNIPILDQGQSGYIGFHNNEPGVVASMEEPVVVFTNHTCNYRLITRPFSCIQNVLPYVGINGYPTIFVYYLTREKIKMNDYKGHWPEFEEQVFIVPPTGLALQFVEGIKSILEESIGLENENQELSVTRDSLLPKLMSGKIQI